MAETAEVGDAAFFEAFGDSLHLNRSPKAASTLRSATALQDAAGFQPWQ
jgi:hypothetical protein